MSNFADLMPPSIFTDTLGDDVIYHARAGDVVIRAIVSDYLEPAFSGEAHVGERRKKIDIAVADVSCFGRKSELTVRGIRYVVDDIVADDGQFLACVVRPK
jgi:hypothetical protein